MNPVSLAFNLQWSRRRPVSLVHFVTDRCNARCPFCFIDFDAPTHGHGELSLSEITALTRGLKGGQLYNVNLTGGEPFLRADITEIGALWLGTAGADSLFITTNGSLTDETVEFAQELSRLFPSKVLAFSISMDALPEEHANLRRLKGLGHQALKTYHALDNLGGRVMANMGITVSPSNMAKTPALYEFLVTEAQVKAITATLVRGSGVYHLPEKNRGKLAQAYSDLTTQISTDPRLTRYGSTSLHGRMMNQKNNILHNVIAKQAKAPQYISPCHAGSLFGIIGATGEVYPCEVLEGSLGNLRDHDMSLMALWRGKEAEKTRETIKKDRCHCTYECAWTFNILGNKRYAPKLMSALLPRKVH